MKEYLGMKSIKIISFIESSFIYLMNRLVELMDPLV